MIVFRQSSLSPEKKELLFANTARAIGAAPREVQIRHVGNCMQADPAYGKGVAEVLGIPLQDANLQTAVTAA